MRVVYRVPTGRCRPEPAREESSFELTYRIQYSMWHLHEARTKADRESSCQCRVIKQVDGDNTVAELLMGHG